MPSNDGHGLRKRNKIPRRAGFLLVVLIASFSVVEGTGLAQQQRQGLRVASDHPSMIDSFLSNPVDSTDALVAVLQKDKQLRLRYARHFNLPEDRIVDFVRNALIVDHLKQDRVVNNYCVTKTGHVYFLRQTFKKGTKVWALRDGTPILRWACANPLAKRLPISMSTRRPLLSPPPEVLGEKPRQAELLSAPAIPEVQATLAVAPVEEPVLSDTSNLQSVPSVAGSSSVVVPGPAIPVHSSYPFLPLSAIVLPILGLPLHPGSSGITPHVPEPGSMSFLILLAPSAIYPKRLRRKTRGR